MIEGHHTNFLYKPVDQCKRLSLPHFQIIFNTERLFDNNVYISIKIVFVQVYNSLNKGSYIQIIMVDLSI